MLYVGFCRCPPGIKSVKLPVYFQDVEPSLYRKNYYQLTHISYSEKPVKS
jgi:hypothetical protein